MSTLRCLNIKNPHFALHDKLFFTPIVHFMIHLFVSVYILRFVAAESDCISLLFAFHCRRCFTWPKRTESRQHEVNPPAQIFYKGKFEQATHHRGEAGDESDAVLHLLLCHLHRRAVFLLQRKRVWAVLGHPGVELQPHAHTLNIMVWWHRLIINKNPFPIFSFLRVTLISGTEILVSGFLSNIFSMSSLNSLLITGLRGMWQCTDQ